MTASSFASGRQWSRWPDLDQFQHQAQELLESYRAGDAEAIAEVARYEQAPLGGAFALHDAQRVLARSYGFSSWRDLESYVQQVENYRQPSPHSDDEANRFLRLACITYFDGDHPSRRQRARRIFTASPQLAKTNIHTAAAVGDLAAVAGFLAQGADVNGKGGPFDWPPLLYAAYSRLDDETEGRSTLQAAQLLLQAGADPNAGFLWDWGFAYPCLLTALTGVLGLGEDDVLRSEGPLWQPPHPRWNEFARLLLEAGADPNDNQGLYNRMQFPDDEHLELLLSYGLGKGQGGPWFERLFRRWPCVDERAAVGYLPRSPSAILAYQLNYAVRANYLSRVQLLVEHGADVNGDHPQYPAGARPPYAQAACDGHQQIADYLLAMGARPVALKLTAAEEFAVACNRADARRARELLASDPSLSDEAQGLLAGFAEAGRLDSIRLMMELGADVNGPAGAESPLHCAARAGQLDAVQLLVQLGASVHARDCNFNGTPLGFANYKNQRRVVEYLLQFAPIGEAVKYGGLERVRDLLRENPECVHWRDDAGCTALHFPDRDTPGGEEMVELLIAHGADVDARDNQGRTPLDQMLHNRRDDLADVLRRHGASTGRATDR